jgi:hypothetical protein
VLVYPTRGLRARRVGIDRQTLMDVISGVGVVIAPAIRPDPRRPQLALAGSQDDAERFVVEYQGQTRHAQW